MGCEVGHEPASHMLAQPARVSLERGFCPVCPDKELEGHASGGLGWAQCPCCGSQWRLEDDGFALRPGRILEEWT
jgi:hypothetical protein